MNERQPQRPCGCVGIFFQLFDRNRRFTKKLFTKKLLSPACLKQASKKFGGDEKQPKLRLDQAVSPKRLQLLKLKSNVADKLGARPGGSDKEDMDFEMAEIKSSEPEDKVLVESVDSVDDEALFPEPDRDLSDCETSLSTRRSCRELIHNVSGVLSKIDQSKGNKLSYAKQVILNAELIFRTTPQQQALLVEDGFSVGHFLLNEHEMFLSFLWMDFDSKFSPISDSGFRTCTKLPSSMTKEILIADIIDEVEEWTQFIGLIQDELIEWDRSHSLGKCTNFEIEEYECGTKVARHIIQELVDEVVLDLYSSS
ncbi:hypothetical protein BC332_27447 [Capsicum chinense]|nr:hypothetical protein BC332_27447 [Capsicum chinense]